MSMVPSASDNEQEISNFLAEPCAWSSIAAQMRLLRSIRMREKNRRMTDAEQREAARQFANKWHGRGNEDEDGRSYWIDFLGSVMGMENVTDRVNFEKKVVVDGNTKRIDAYIPETHVLIEQKSLNKKLDEKIHPLE